MAYRPLTSRGLARGRGGGVEILAENCWGEVLSPGERRPEDQTS